MEVWFKNLLEPESQKINFTKDDMLRTFIYGAGGHGKVAADTAVKSGVFLCAFLDDGKSGQLMGLQIMSPDHVRPARDVLIHFAIGRNDVRRRLQMAWEERGGLPCTITHSLASICDSELIGAGSLILPNAIVAAGATVGKGCILNHGTTIDHDCTVGDFTHLAARAVLCGGVNVGSDCLVGAGAIILPGVTIGNGVTVGAGSVVLSDVEDGEKIVGNPARALSSGSI
jgi:sugar O-acyltransferase (sialic acid O-acetyltransferase NeuD family)